MAGMDAAYVFENIGLTLPTDDHDAAYVFENIGLPWETIWHDVHYSYYGDVDTTVPIPHIWFLRPTAGREGDGFSIYGHGFGATNATYNGHAWLNTIQLNETAWQQIAAGTNAYNSLRNIDAVVGEPTMEHGRIDVTVPPGASDGMVRVETDI